MHKHTHPDTHFYIPPLGDLGTDCVHLTATITLSYCKCILTVKLQSAHSEMIQKGNKSSVELLGEKSWEDLILDIFSARHYFPLGGCFQKPCHAAVSGGRHTATFQLAFYTHLLWVRECGHEKTQTWICMCERPCLSAGVWASGHNSSIRVCAHIRTWGKLLQRARCHCCLVERKMKCE